MERKLACLALFLGSTVPMNVLAQEFHPSMVEVGVVQSGQHVTFNPPFPSTPQVVFSDARHFEGGGHYECGFIMSNLSPTGFD
jgi:hypothetical protein